MIVELPTVDELQKEPPAFIEQLGARLVLGCSIGGDAQGGYFWKLPNGSELSDVDQWNPMNDLNDAQILKKAFDRAGMYRQAFIGALSEVITGSDFEDIVWAEPYEITLASVLAAYRCEESKAGCMIAPPELTERNNHV